MCFSVTDDGAGMDAETVVRALDPFFTTKGPGKGPGLRLPMVHGFAQQSGGNYVLSSTPGEDTRSELWLPILNSEAATVAPTPDKSIRPALEVSGGHSILAVDDDQPILMNTEAMLEELGHVPNIARTAQRALAILRSGRKVDLVITDHAMPQMTGAQLAVEIAEEWPQLPVILATGYAELEHGMADDVAHLAKPYGLNELKAEIDRLAAPKVVAFNRGRS